MSLSQQLITEFTQALQKEIDALKKSKGGSVVKIFNGRFLRETSGMYLYLFHLENFLVALDDTPAELVMKGNRYQCQIVSVQGMEVQIALEHHLGQDIAEAKLQTNLWYLLELLRKKFEESIPQAGTRFKMSDRLFQGISTVISKGQELEYSLLPNHPNPSQKNAIAASFAKSLAVIWGPPGTGKTKTIAKAVEAHLKAGRRMLLVSHANTAVDEALEDIAEQLKSSYYQEGKLVRLGVCHKKTLEEEYPLVILNHIATKLGESLVKEKSVLLNEREEIDRILANFQSLISTGDMAKKVEREREELSKALPQMLNDCETAKSDITALEESMRRALGKLYKAKNSGALARILLGRDPVKVQREIDHLRISLDTRKRSANEMEQRY